MVEIKLRFENTPVVWEYTNRLINQNHEGKKANLKVVHCTLIVHCMLKQIDWVEIPNHWVNKIPSGWHEKQDSVLPIVSIMVFFNVILDR